MKPTAHRMTMDINRIHLLLVEDDEDDAVVFRNLIDEIDNWHIDLDWAPTFKTALEKTYENSHDLCMIDFRLGGKNGVDLIWMMKANGLNIPMIMLTGKADRSIDLQAMASGATAISSTAQTRQNPADFVFILRGRVKRPIRNKWTCSTMLLPT